MAKRKLKYKARSFKDQRKRIDQSAIARDSFVKDGLTFFKPAEGTNTIRILPPTWENAEHYGYDLFMHYNVGSDNASYLCPKAMHHGDERCPVCEERERAELEAEPEDYVKSLRPKKRVAYYLINRDKPGEGILFWPAPWTVDKEIAIQAVDTNTQEYVEVDNPDEGYDITIHRQGTNQLTEYNVKISRKESEVDLTDDMVDFLEESPIPEILVFYPYDHIKKVFEGGIASKRGETIEKNLDSAKTAKIPSWRKLSNMNKEELEEIIEVFFLDVDSDKYDEEELVKIVAEELGIEVPKSKLASKPKAAPEPEPEEDEEEDEEESEDDEPEEESEEDEEEESSPPPKKSSSVRDRLRNLGR